MDSTHRCTYVRTYIRLPLTEIGLIYHRLSAVIITIHTCMPTYINHLTYTPRAAGWTLRNLAVNAENKVLIVEEGGLVPLIALLHSMNERAQEHAAGALRSLSVNAENQNLIVQNLGLPPLVALLHSQNAAVQEQAVVCIRNLSVNDENEVKIVQEGALPPLIKLLQSPVERIQV